MRKQHFRPYGQEIGSLRISPASSGGALARYESSTNNGTTWFDIMPDPANAVSTVAAWPVFDETNPDDVNIGQPAKLNLTGAFTITCWASQTGDASQSYEYLISRDDSNGGAAQRSYLLTQRDTDGKPYWEMFLAVGGYKGCQGFGSFDDSQWHFYACVNEGAGGDMVFYIDGALNNTAAGNGGVVNNTHYNHMIGRTSSGPPSGLSGRCDTARYYDRALSADEIFRDYIAGKGAHQ